MGATAPCPDVTEMVPIEHTEIVPIEHERSERVVRTMVFAVPPAAVAFGGMAGVGPGPALAGNCRSLEVVQLRS